VRDCFVLRRCLDFSFLYSFRILRIFRDIFEKRSIQKIKQNIPMMKIVDVGTCTTKFRKSERTGRNNLISRKKGCSDLLIEKMKWRWSVRSCVQFWKWRIFNLIFIPLSTKKDNDKKHIDLANFITLSLSSFSSHVFMKLLHEILDVSKMQIVKFFNQFRIQFS
jgi:hypothetical protein